MTTDPTLTHIDEDGRPRMVDVSNKSVTVRTAVAMGRVSMSSSALMLALSDGGKKGDVRAVAELAGIMAAKRTSDLIPLCHPLPLSSVKVAIGPAPHGANALDVTATVKTTGQTGVEMEALTAVTVACLTIYDMLKSVDRDMVIAHTRLIEKTGGASGDYRAAEPG